jgi:hypothetical protein
MSKRGPRFSEKEKLATLKEGEKGLRSRRQFSMAPAHPIFGLFTTAQS